MTPIIPVSSNSNVSAHALRLGIASAIRPMVRVMLALLFADTGSVVLEVVVALTAMVPGTSDGECARSTRGSRAGPGAGDNTAGGYLRRGAGGASTRRVRAVAEVRR